MTAGGRRFGGPAHLIRRFLWSVRGEAPDAGDERWLRSLLSDPERRLYDAQPEVDRAHSVRCAVAARQGLGPAADDSVVVASALHDVGKTPAGLGTPARVLATVLATVAPQGLLDRWARGDGFGSRLVTYTRHDEIGAELLEAAGSAAVVVAWAREHHLPEDEWTVDPDVGRILLDADG